jgi:hypothetical protein
VSRLGNLIGGSASRWFISTRGFSSVLALLLALSYTKILGIDKRSILAFIMVSALILTVVLTSGLSLALRNKPKEEIKNEEFVGYLILLSILSLCAGGINCLLLLFYSNIKSDIPAPIFVVCFVYTVLACANLGIQDALLAAGDVKTAVIFDLLTILIQIVSLLFFVKIAQTSLMVSVFISFIFSYSLISFASATILLVAFPTQSSHLNIGARSILKQSKKHVLFGIASGLVDRVDRFLIGLILPIAFLAKYALLSSIISFARFLPDSSAKISLLAHHSGEKTRGVSYSPQQMLFILAAGALFVTASQGFIYIAFGNAWVLPLYVAALLVCQEILRGNYQMKATELVALGGAHAMSRISGLLILLSLSLITVFVFILGVWGAPLAMLVVYSLLTFLVDLELKKIPSAH